MQHNPLGIALDITRHQVKMWREKTIITYFRVVSGEIMDNDWTIKAGNEGGYQYDLCSLHFLPSQLKASTESSPEAPVKHIRC